MSIVEGMGLIQVATTENFRVWVAEQLLAEQSANGVVHRIADNRRNHHQHNHHVHVDVVRRQRGERPGDKQQRVTRQEWRHHQPRFTE